MYTDKDKKIRDNYCNLFERSTLKALHGHYRIATLLDKWASKIVRDYRR